MFRFTDAMADAIHQKNWYAALFICLALPDICGSLENPQEQVGVRYRDWFNRYVASRGGSGITADDCYYFRCACLHQGLDFHARMESERIHFIAPTPGVMVHGNMLNNVLQMQIDQFCLEMGYGVHLWMKDVQGNEEIQNRMNQLIRIHPLSSLPRMFRG